MEMAEEDTCYAWPTRVWLHMHVRMKPTVKNFSNMLFNGTTAILSAELEHHVA